MTIELIESKLRILNADTFHRLADHFLFYDEGHDYESINPIGQSEGKQKSRKGTPDTKIRLASGQYIFIQYTTQEDYPNRDILYKKLVDDLGSCLDVTKSKVELNEISKIVLCFNSNINPETETKLYEAIRGKGISLKLINLSTIAHKIYKFYPFLAKDYLGIEIDTYQLLPLQKFIDEYEKGGFATPLSNSFLHRKEELKEAKQSVKRNLITIISGKAGVGKSRLAVEIVKQQFKKDDGVAYCIKNKDLPIIYDLRRNLTDAKKYLIYIDDANKSITQLKEVMSFYQENDVQFKLIITVRDYVLSEIMPFVREYPFQVVNLEKMKSEEIVKIIAAKPFNIRNHYFQKRIKEVARGNPRLAVMTAVASRKKKLSDLDNVSDIYDLYFQRVSKDNPLLTDQDYIRIMGILAFFRVIDRDQRDLCEKIYKAFNINENDFWTKVYNLERFEIVDVFTDRSSVKFSDQILEGFIFYKCFFTERLIDYSIILDNFFPGHAGRVSYTAIDANNTFGFKNFKDLILPYIQKKYRELDHDGQEIISFLKIFWLYLQEETLLLAKKRIDQQPVATDLTLMDEVVTVKYHTKTFAFQDGVTLDKDIKDDIFDLISEFLKYEVQDFDLAVELMFAYIERRQDLAEKLVEFIGGYFNFNDRDALYNYYREVNFTRLIIAKAAEGRPVFRYVLLKIIPHFLKTRFNTTYSENLHIHISYTEPEAKGEFLEVRKMYWEYFIGTYGLYPKLSLFTLKAIVDTFYPDFHKEARITDWPFIEALIAKNLDVSRFEDAYAVNQILERIERGDIDQALYLNLKKIASTPDYKKYLALDWSTLRRKERYARENEDYATFEKRFAELKKKEILAAFNFTDFNSYSNVFDFMGKCADMQLWEFYNATNASQVIINHLMQNTDYFPEIFSYLIKKDYFSKIFSHVRLFNNIQHERNEYIDIVERTLLTEEYANKTIILCDFYGCLNEANVTASRARTYLNVMGTITGRYCFYFDNAGYYVKVNTSFLRDAIKKLLKLAEDGQCTFDVGSDFIEHNFNYLGGTEIAEKLYLYLFEHSHHFDYEGSELSFILKKDVAFFGKYIELILNEKKSKREEHPQMGVVWKTDNYLIAVEGALDRLTASHSRNRYGVETIISDLFEGPRGAKDGFDEKRELAISNYIGKYFNDKRRMKVLFKVIVAKKIAFKENIQRLLTLNADIEMFKAIDWTHSGTLLRSGNTISGEVDEAKWNKIRSIIDELTPKSNYLEHRAYINLQIDYCRRSAISERKWDFIDPY